VTTAVPAPAAALPVAGPARQRVRALVAACGPAFVVSVAYVDPGNFATNATAGARYGPMLLWVIAAANLLAILVQYLSAKLGLATGASLPELCRRRYRRPVVVLLWAQAELVAMATDLAEFVGGAVALNLLLGVPLLAAAGITAAVSAGLLALAPGGRRRFETVVVGLLAVILLGFCYEMLHTGSLAGAARAATGLVPRLAGGDSLLLATGIVGATVMPHVVYLHSALTGRSADPTTAPGASATGAAPGAVGGPGAAGGAGWSAAVALRAHRRGIVLALGLAGAVNMAILLVAAEALGGRPVGGSLAAIHGALGGAAGPVAAAVFALALLASGLASSSVGTYAGQVIMDGFLRRRVPLLVRRAVTMLPPLAVLAAGVEPTTALVGSQVALSFGIPFAVVPLVALTRCRRLMGQLVNRRRTTAAAVAVAALITGLNVVLVASTITA
jgi:manganese transport protein